MTRSVPLLASSAPQPLVYGTVAFAVLTLGYLLGVRQLLGRKQKHDLVVAAIVVLFSGFLGLVLLFQVSIETVLGYLYGIVIGGSGTRLVTKYRNENR